MNKVRCHIIIVAILFISSVDATTVLQEANKGLVFLRHYIESHNGRMSDEVTDFIDSTNTFESI
jgi:hypothetical protein